MLPDGRIEFMGRADGQVKIRGFRIELEEIEEVIRQYQGVQNAAVQVVEFGPGDKRLVAYVIGVAQISQEQLKSFLRELLPSFMVPAEFIAVRSLPSTPSGKIDRQALKALRPKPNAQTRTIQPPGDEIEYKLVRIWESILKVRPLGITDNFFDLGGHSLLAARMFAAIEKKLRVSIPLSMLVENPTIELLALRIRQQLQGNEWPALVAIQPLGSKPPLFVVHGLGGSLFSFRPLVAALGTDQPVYGLQRSDNSSDRPTIKALAARYVNEIQVVDPVGPYNIAGHSSGGMIAFEVASQLVAQGREVNVLALLDCDYRFGKRSAKTSTSSQESLNFIDILKQSYKHVLRQASEIGWIALFWRRYFHEKIKMQLWLLKHSPWKRKYYPSLFGAEAYLALSAETYEPRPYPGDVMLFIADYAAKPNDDFGAGWAKSILGKLLIIKTPGGHQSILTEPNVASMAKELMQRLERKTSTEEAVLGV
jgi:thioesterase domain-containing protein/acyl carrier protein